MPTPRQIEAQLKKESAIIKRDMVSEVISSAMHILNDSYLKDSSVWPKNGFEIGDGLSVGKADCIFVGVMIPDVRKEPVAGRLHMWPTTNKRDRERSQKKHIRLILDCAIYNSITFENEFKNYIEGDLWFQFTINE